MAKVESCIVWIQQAQKSEDIIVYNTESNNYILRDCKDSSSSDDNDDDDDDMVELLLFLYTPFLKKVCNLYLLMQ